MRFLRIGISDSRCGLVKEARPHDETSFDCVPIRLRQVARVRLQTVDQLPVGDGRSGHGALEHEVGQVGDPCAPVEAVVPVPGVARRVLGADLAC